MIAAFSFLITIAYWPGLPGAALTPRWAILALVVPLYLLGRHNEVTIQKPTLDAWPTLAVLGLLAWAALSLLWSSSPWDGLQSLQQLAILAGVGAIGFTLPSLVPVYLGAALGMGVNSVLIMLEMGGINVTGHLVQERAGLFFNPNIVTETGAIVLVACAAHGRWWYGALVLPAIIFTHSRGGLVALAAAGLYATRNKSIILAAALIFALSIGLTFFNQIDPSRGGKLLNLESVKDRWQIWTNTASLLTWHGNGVGSLRVEFPRLGAGYTDHAHNDYLELAHDLGLPGVIFVSIILISAFKGKARPEKLVMVAFLIEAVFQFPLWMPVTGSLGALAIGHLLRQ